MEGPKLPEIPGSNGGQYIGISAAGIAGGILEMLILGATVGLGYLFWHRKNRESECDVEKQSTYISYDEQEEEQFLESKTLTTGHLEAKQSLLSPAVNPIPKLKSPSSSISGPSSSQTFNDLRK